MEKMLEGLSITFNVGEKAPNNAQRVGTTPWEMPLDMMLVVRWLMMPLCRVAQCQWWSSLHIIPPMARMIIMRPTEDPFGKTST
jgi:hypothetical protein